MPNDPSTGAGWAQAPMLTVSEISADAAAWPIPVPLADDAEPTRRLMVSPIWAVNVRDECKFTGG